MGLFGKKKKKKIDDYSDDGGNDGPGDDGPGDMPAFQGSDDNPYAEDPAHKQLVKLLDSNGLVRHRRAFIRNSVYTVKHAKDCDADRLQKIGVFLEADRKKLLRIFKDVEPVESELDKQREQEKMDMDEREDEEEESSKKSKKKKKDKKDKGDKKKKKKKKKKDKDLDDEEDDDLDFDMNDEEEESGKKKKKKEKKKDKSEKKDKKKKGKKSKKDKSKKSKKSSKDEETDFDDLDGLDDEPMEEDFDEPPKKEKKSKKGKKKKDKKSKKDKKKKEKMDFEEEEDFPREAGVEDQLEIDMGEEEERELRDEDLYSPEEKHQKPKPQKPEPEPREEPTRDEIVEDLDEEIKESEKKAERRMSHGSQALKMLNKKLGLERRNSILSTTSKQRRRSVATVDEDEELWWQSLDSKDQARRISFTDDSYSEASAPKQKKKLKVKPEYGTKLEYLTDAEAKIVQNLRKQSKVTRRQRPVTAPYYQLPQQVYNSTEQFAPPPPPPLKQMLPETSLQPPGEATNQRRQMSPPMPPSQIPIQSQQPNGYNYFYPPMNPYHQQPPPQTMYYSDEEEAIGSDGQSTVDFSKYKYYKEKYNEKKKEKKKRKHRLKQKIKSQSKLQHKKVQKKKRAKKTRADFVDVSSDLFTDNPIWPTKGDGDFVNDSEVNAESSGGEQRVHKYGNDNYFFNQHSSDERLVRKGRRGQKKRNLRKVNYYSSANSEYESEATENEEVCLLRKKLAELGASRYYPLLVKQGILSLKHCTMSKLESLPIASRSRKKALVHALLQMKKSSKNRKDSYISELEFTDDSENRLERSGKLGLKSSIKKSSLKRRRPKGVSKTRTGTSRHYFTPGPGQVSLAESDAEPDHVRVVKQSEKKSTNSQERKSVTFDLNDEDEISLPSFSEAEENSDSELSLDSYDSA